MGVEIDIVYEGELHCDAVHGPSKARVATDAPKDNEGKGEAFSPTDLLATALGTCMMTVMGIHARKLDVDLRGTKVHVVKDMTAKPRRRVGKLTVNISVPRPVDAKHRAALEQTALTCPVATSLSPDVELATTFSWA